MDKEPPFKRQKMDTSISNKLSQTPRLLMGDLIMEDTLGGGQEGLVVKVTTKENPNEAFAVKLYSTTPDRYEKLVTKREIDTLLAIAHPNIVAVKALVCKNDKIKGFAMDVMDRSLHDVTYDKKIKYSLSQLCNWFWQASEGILYLHEMGIIHRDIKPKKTGTYSYMAPEVMDNESSPSAYTTQADIYSFAMTMFEVHFRRSPFKAMNCSKEMEFCEAILNGKRPVNVLNDSLSFIDAQSILLRILFDLIQVNHERDLSGDPLITTTTRGKMDEFLVDLGKLSSARNFSDDPFILLNTHLKLLEILSDLNKLNCAKELDSYKPIRKTVIPIFKELIMKGWNKEAEKRPTMESIRNFLLRVNTCSLSFNSTMRN